MKNVNEIFMMRAIINFCLLLITVVISSQVNAKTQSSLTVEEMRLANALVAMPTIKEYFNWSKFKDQWPHITDHSVAQRAMARLGDEIWQHNKVQVQSGKIVDDRPLYWNRLAIKHFIKQSPSVFLESQLNALLEVFENSSRGYSDLGFSRQTNKKILLTGFDPFLLDRNLEQSNPSGLNALLLDGKVICYQTSINGKLKTITAEINTAMIPVRFEDFDQGEIESLLAPFYATNSVDMIATVSMGRRNFDLEHFPGLRRSSKAPDNLNVYTGATLNNPVIPLLTNKPLASVEFVEYSLPFQAMMQAKGDFKVKDNRGVTIFTSGKANDIIAVNLAELSDKVSVQGGGGGYLSNEISYRSIRLRNILKSTIATGHIHTPSIKSFDRLTNKKITAQIEAMLILALPEI
jgi:pyrrolidone-carboxylate peptidase